MKPQFAVVLGALIFAAVALAVAFYFQNRVRHAVEYREARMPQLNLADISAAGGTIGDDIEAIKKLESEENDGQSGAHPFLQILKKGLEDH